MDNNYNANHHGKMIIFVNFINNISIEYYYYSNRRVYEKYN